MIHKRETITFDTVSSFGEDTKPVVKTCDKINLYTIVCIYIYSCCVGIYVKIMCNLFV